MCMCFVDFHPSVWCSSKGGLFHIFVLFTRKSKPYPLAPKANLETKKGGRPERSSSSTGVHSTVSLLIRTHSCAVGPSTRPHWLLPLHKLPPIADHLFEKKRLGGKWRESYFLSLAAQLLCRLQRKLWPPLHLTAIFLCHIVENWWLFFRNCWQPDLVAHVLPT